MATKRKATGAGAGFITPRPAWEYSPAQSAVKKRVEEQYGLWKKTSRAAGGRVVAAPMTQNDAIVIKATKLAAYFHTHNKNLTKFQYELVCQLWDVLSDWKYVRKNLREYNLDGVRKKPE